jgi:hemerythrin-like metal-binding protein
MTFDWQPEYGTGFAEIDGLHRRVFRAAGELDAAIVAGQPPDTLARLLAAAVSCTRAHFAAEEALMLSSRYPESVRHTAKHTTMGDQLIGLQESRPSVETMQSLKSALVQHIDEEDRELGRYLASRAGGQATG